MLLKKEPTNLSSRHRTRWSAIRVISDKNYASLDPQRYGLKYGQIAQEADGCGILRDLSLRPSLCKDCVSGWALDLRVQKRKLVFPIETTRRNPRVRQPVERDVVEHVVLCKSV